MVDGGPVAPRVVLVEPMTPANVGFTARVLANFGLSDWCLLGGCGWRGTEAERTGAPARPVLEGVREVEALDEAVSGCTHVVGFTARTGRHREGIDLTDLPVLAAGWGTDARPALLFGREDRGLEVNETESCAHLVTIRTRGFSSLNLSHAVAVALHEWYRDEARPASPPPDRPWADASERMRCATAAQAELAACDFPDRGEELEAALRRLAALPIETRDLRTLDRILRHARWLREGREGSGRDGASA